MNGLVVLGGLTEQQAIDLQHGLFMTVVEPKQRREGALLAAAVSSACQNSPYMQNMRNSSFNDILARPSLFGWR